ncbi:hypothetical protein H1S01_12755 [Heliobacterium chlorum]|uniref:Lipoprotein n=1 Tax=Heliobacterium chlorum TaxID=2698 RepID=A0ABR7T5T1_HELCL|nr:hypothetical protein [Heliobacterium chlorum]MBC9785378.1 hypothetical protein [Heliobacterium chlorum]
MFKKVLIGVVASAILALTGCGGGSNQAPASSNQQQSTATNVPAPEPTPSSSQSSPTIEAETAEYLLKITPIFADIEKNNTNFENLRQQAANGTLSGKDFAQKIRDEILPSYAKSSEQLSGINPPSSMREAQDTMIKMITKNNQGMNEFIAALENNDLSRVTVANGYFAEASALDQQVATIFQNAAPTPGK